MLRKPSPALVVACLALLAALAGTGVASVKISQRPSAAGVIHVHPVFVPGTSRGGAIANCPAGTRATGGGAYLEGTPSNDDHTCVISWFMPWCVASRVSWSASNPA